MRYGIIAVRSISITERYQHHRRVTVVSASIANGHAYVWHEGGGPGRGRAGAGPGPVRGRSGAGPGPVIVASPCPIQLKEKYRHHRRIAVMRCHRLFLWAGAWLPGLLHRFAVAVVPFNILLLLYYYIIIILLLFYHFYFVIIIFIIIIFIIILFNVTQPGHIGLTHTETTTKLTSHKQQTHHHT